MKQLEPVDTEYLSKLTGIWLERYRRLLRIYRGKKYDLNLAIQLAYNDVKNWKETGKL
jgi:hypothetical protein